MISVMEKAQLLKKIKTMDDLMQAIGPRPRSKKVIMCHGAFDVVHPGHIRHLLYAKSKADVLVASLTSDAHITKAAFRPYVPEDLRAINLAALEMVDYVVVDPNPTPLENLKLIQPDFFAKGYEYIEGQMHPKTKEEKEVIDSYGGEIIFTPGDIVYSSSALIELAPPKIAIEKLVTMMEAEGVSFDDLRKALYRMDGQSVHVVGDTIVDSYTICTLVGGMTKTPTISVRFLEQTDFTGGAAVVAKHLASTGAKVTLSTVLGDDPLKDFVLEDLKQAGVNCLATVDPTRPTTNKNAIVAEEYRLLKVDKVDNRSISEKILHRMCQEVAESTADIVVFSDFRHGIFNRQTIPELVAAIPTQAFKVADSQVASRWGNILQFQGFDLITPNEREARFALGDQDSALRPLASELYRQADCQTIILKLGERGILTYRTKPEGDPRTVLAVDSFADKVVDAVGSGDALLAYASLALKQTGNEVIASVLGSFAAGVACQHDGNVPVSPRDVAAKIDTAEKLASFG